MSKYKCLRNNLIKPRINTDRMSLNILKIRVLSVLICGEKINLLNLGDI